jgi:hypothetical protein
MYPYLGIDQSDFDDPRMDEELDQEAEWQRLEDIAADRAADYWSDYSDWVGPR